MTDYHLGTSPAPAATALSGKGILITRPMWQAVPLAQKLSALGAIPFIFPAIIIEANAAIDLPAAQNRLAKCSKAFFVSANAAREGLMGLQQFPKHVTAYGPGPGTAEALRSCGADLVCMPTTSYDTQGLLALPELQSLHGQRIMVFTGLVSGKKGKRELADALVARGAEVETIDCYTRRPPETAADGLLEAWNAGRIHASVLTSAEGIRNFYACLPAAAKRAFFATPAFVPHPNVATAALQVGVSTVITSPPGDDALIAALIQSFEKTS